MTGTEMMRISDLNAMEVQVEVSENDILKVKVGDEADIEVDAYTGKKFKGEVTHISNSASNIKSAWALLL
ncbi:MAG: efflux RND transporter periplasmic adaptor subunit [Saprospiraceae bacterium]|nr:efflux RND transporter periplasmic adaptor subunit [Saprospiraceae bacterium]